MLYGEHLVQFQINNMEIHLAQLLSQPPLICPHR